MRRCTQAPLVRHSRVGYTIIEMIIALLLGVIILSAAITFLITHLRTLEGSDIRENVERNGRYIGVLLRRDVQSAGIDIESSTQYATVAVFPGSTSDTLFMLYVPYIPANAEVYTIDTSLPQPPLGQGTCSPTDRCMTVTKEAADPFELGPADLARLQVSSTRRLIIVESINIVNSTTVEVTFTQADTLFHMEAGLLDLQLQMSAATWIQKLTPLIYYVDSDEQLLRAQRVNIDSSPNGNVVAHGVDAFDLSLVFADGDTLGVANPDDADDSNDYDDIVGVRVNVTVKADRTDPRVNNGQLLKRTYEWQMSPRNLRYEKNRS